MEELTAVGAAVAAEVIKSLAKDMADFLKVKMRDFFTDQCNKEQIDAGWAFERYLTDVRDTYSYSKSILYESEPRKLSSFFEPVDLELKSEIYRPSKDQSRIRRSDDHTRISSKKVTDLMSQGTNLLIIGSGGTGKTILMKHFCVDAIDSAGLVPVFISLRWFNNVDIAEEPFEKLIYEQMKISKFELDYEYFLYSLKGDKYLFLFDGYDEISKVKRPLLSHLLSDFTRKYEDNYFVISSRQVEDIFGWDKFKIFEICPLEFRQAIALISRLEFDLDTRRRFVKELKGGLYDKYRSFVSVPLLLSILFITYAERATLPETLTQFYEEAYEVLLYRRDKKKEGLDRILDSKLSYEDFRKVFMYFCYNTYFSDEYSFTERQLIERISESGRKQELKYDAYAYKNDLTEIACMLIKDGREYTFIHRSFQEYFAAYYISLQLDDQQRRFCSAYMHSSHGWFGIFNDHCSFEELKVLTFFDMLRSIEPKRFDGIVLQPIREKIHDLYVRNKRDLVETTSSLFLFQQNRVEGSFYYFNYHIRLFVADFDETNMPTAQELGVLDQYNKNQRSKLPMSLDEKIDRIIIEGLDDNGSCKIFNRNGIDYRRFYKIDEKNSNMDISIELSQMFLSYVAVALKQYDEFVSKANLGTDFKNIFENL